MRGFNDRITAYGFVLTVFVIWLHAGESLISIIPGQIAVPGFFMMSGYLFFRGFNGESSYNNVFKRKLLSRVKSLLVPYLLWNFIYFLVYFAFGKAELTDLPEAVFLYGCNPVFWYLYQLLLITVLTPLIFVCMRKRAGAFCWLTAVFIAAVFYSVLPFHYCNEDALFYYSLGGFCSLSNTDISRVPIKRAGIWALVFALTWALQYVLPVSLMNLSAIGWRASGAALLWIILNFICDHMKEARPPGFMRISFFVYAAHYLIIRAVWALGLRDSVIVYLLMPVICIGASYGIFLLMEKLSPKVLSVLTGGRQTKNERNLSACG